MVSFLIACEKIRVKGKAVKRPEVCRRQRKPVNASLADPKLDQLDRLRDSCRGQAGSSSVGGVVEPGLAKARP